MGVCCAAPGIASLWVHRSGNSVLFQGSSSLSVLSVAPVSSLKHVGTFDPLDQGGAHCGPQAKACFCKIKFYSNMAMPVHLHMNYGCF